MGSQERKVSRLSEVEFPEREKTAETMRKRQKNLNSNFIGSSKIKRQNKVFDARFPVNQL